MNHSSITSQVLQQSSLDTLWLHTLLPYLFLLYCAFVVLWLGVSHFALTPMRKIALCSILLCLVSHVLLSLLS